MLTVYNPSMPRLDISFLGTIQVSLNRQPITHFRSANNQGLLVFLTLQPEKPLSRELLTAVFWPEESDKNARNNLRQSLYQLRKLLGDLNEPAQPYLLVTRQTVQFNPKSDYQLDVRQFLQAVDAGDLETAVSHYHDDLLPGFTCDSLEFESWLRQEREHLHHLALETMLEAGRDCLQNGRYDKAQTIARQQLALEPWREQAHRQLMQALALAGDRANALNQFEQCQAALREELGIEPAPETITLFEEIKSGQLAPTATAETIRPPVKVRHNLPATTTLLVGREVEIEQISQWFMQDAKRLVTIVAPGGMGKTRLGTAVGATLLEQYADGVYFVDLAPLEHPDEIGTAIASVLDYQAPDKTKDLLPQLLATLSQQQMLLILDNFEHLLSPPPVPPDGGEALVSRLLQTCPRLSILITSRQRLNLASENRFELGGLDVPEWLTPEDAAQFTAVQLFVANGRRVQPDFVLNDSNVTDVVHICQLVQGMPLGLLLAATWLELLAPAEIAVEIEDSLDFLTTELADLPPRQRSMQAVFDYSWQMMNATEQAVLAKLSVFRGGFTREAAAEVAEANLRVLLALVNKSLLQREEESGRFTIHELLRQFATAQRLRLDAKNSALFAHCTYFAEKIKGETHKTAGFFPLQIPSKYAADRDNLHRAWEFALQDGLAEQLAALVPAIIVFGFRQGKQASAVPAEAVRALQQKNRANSDEALLYLQLLEQTSRFGTDDSSLVGEGLLTLVPFFEKQPYPELRFWLYLWLGLLESPAREAWYDRAHETALEMKDELFINTTEVIRIRWAISDEEKNEAILAKLQELRAFFEPKLTTPVLANSFVFHTILASLQEVSTATGAYEQAIDYGKRSLNMAKEWQDLFWLSDGFHRLTKTYLAMGLLDDAKLQYLDSLEWHLAVGQVWQTLGLLVGLASQFPEFIGGQTTAVSILSMIFHHHEVVVFHKQEIDGALPTVRAELEAAAFAAAWENGKGMGFDTAVSLVRSALQTGK